MKNPKEAWKVFLNCCQDYTLLLKKFVSLMPYLIDLDDQINMNTRKSNSPMKCVENPNKYSLAEHSAVWKPVQVFYNSCSTSITKCINVCHIHHLRT
jgi:hypothetical protein